MWSKRLFATCGALAGLAVVLGVIGWLSGVPLYEWKVQEILATARPITPSISPSSVVARQATGLAIATALLFAWPAISAIVAVILHRWRREVDASARAVIAYVVIPAVVLAGYIWLTTTMFAEGAAGKSSPMPSFTFEALRPGIDEMRIVGFVSLCVWLYTGTRKPAKLGA